MDAHEKDPRDAETIQVHSAMARATLDHVTLSAKELLSLGTGETSQAAEESLQANEQYEYAVRVSVLGAFGLTVSITFFDGDTLVGDFTGIAGGLFVGTGVAWGSAWLQYPIDQIRGWEARFQANFAPATSQINLWGMQGEWIGPVAAGGGIVATGICGGHGTFKK